MAIRVKLAWRRKGGTGDRQQFPLASYLPLSEKAPESPSRNSVFSQSDNIPPRSNSPPTLLLLVLLRSAGLMREHADAPSMVRADDWQFYRRKQRYSIVRCTLSTSMDAGTWSSKRFPSYLPDRVVVDQHLNQTEAALTLCALHRHDPYQNQSEPDMVNYLRLPYHYVLRRRLLLLSR